MTERVGRNDPCPCGSGKKYKACCLKNESTSSASYTPTGKRKFTAKLISGGGMAKTQEQSQSQSQPAIVDYNMLMERSFGEAIHGKDEQPPVPENPLQYLPQNEQDQSK